MKEKVQKLVEYIMAKNYGDIIYHQEIAEKIDEMPKTQRYFSIITKAKKSLQYSGKMITSVRKSGYQVVEPDNYTTHAIDRFDVGLKRIRDGIDIMNVAPLKDMTPEGVEAHNRTYDKMQNINAFMTGATVEVRMLGTRRQNALQAAVQPKQQAV